MKMLDFGMLSYLSIYKFKKDFEENHDSLEEDICFATFFNKWDSMDKVNISFSIFVTSSDSFIIDRCRNHYSILNKSEIEYYLRSLRKIIKFTYKVRESDFYGVRGDFYDIKLYKDSKHIAKKVFLTLFRFIYEHPYCTTLKESIALKRAGYFKGVNIINVTEIVKHAYQGTDYRGGHTLKGLIETVKFESLSAYKNKLEKANCKRIDRLFSSLEDLYDFNFVNNQVFDVKLDEFIEFLKDKQYLESRYNKFHKENFEIYKQVFKKNRKMKNKIEEISPLKVFVVGPLAHYASFLFNYTIVPTIAEADLVIFTGGADVDPSYYGKKAHRSTRSDKDRDASEFALFEEIKALKKKPLVVGICRGSQFLCVANGGLLIQDCSGHALYGTHNISWDHKRFNITSTHHQMQYPFNLDKKDYSILATASCGYGVYKMDDVEELNELECQPEIVDYHKKGLPRCLAIQGHPEMMNHDDEIVIRLNEHIHDLLQENNVKIN